MEIDEDAKSMLTAASWRPNSISNELERDDAKVQTSSG